MPDPSIADLMQRIERLEDTHHIQQLAMRYALAIDERNIDEVVRLFVPDVWVGGGRSGRDALHDIITPQLRLFYRSVHLICGQQITFHEDGRATGTVYCRAEHEVGDRWIVIPVRYDDEYRKVDGEWLFGRRTDSHLYEADALSRPQQVDFHGWPEAPPRQQIPGDAASWAAFWAGVDTSTVTAAPLPDSDSRR